MESSPSQKQLANLLVALQFGFLGLLFFVPTNGTRIFPSLLTQFLTVSGLLIGGKAIFDLRASLRINPIPAQDNKLTIVGSYRFVRHPMYLSLHVIAFSSLLSNFTAARALLVVGLFIVLHIKSKLEDSFLSAVHGQPAIDYQLATGRIFPKF
jgi:protein-S-isoprenylcysteine O-methyltransferase Ste14